jgi:hypothetical protein
MQDTMDQELEGTETAETTEVVETEPSAPPAVKGEDSGEVAAAPSDPPDPHEHRVKGLESTVVSLRKRAQAAEQELTYLRGRLDSHPQQQPKQQEVDWKQEDEKFWAKGPANYTRETAESIARDAARSVQLETDKARLASSERRVSKKHADYPDTLRAFNEMAEREPSLWREIVTDPEPAQAMYDLVKERQSAPTNIEEWKAQTKADLRAEIEEEIRTGKAKQAVARAPKTEAGARGTGVARTPVGDPLDELPNY